MTTIRERDASTVFQEGAFLSRATHDRRALLVAGNALAETIAASFHDGATPMCFCPTWAGDMPDAHHWKACLSIRAALAVWKAATG